MGKSKLKVGQKVTQKKDAKNVNAKTGVVLSVLGNGVWDIEWEDGTKNDPNDPNKP